MNDVLEIALKEYGVAGVTGTANNQRILQYAQEIGANWVQNDETPWCAIFMQWCLKQAGRPYSYMANAAWFMTYGEQTTAPELGDIVLLYDAANPNRIGHVAFWIREYNGLVIIMGGNQSNMADIMGYPISRVAGYRKIPPKLAQGV